MTSTQCAFRAVLLLILLCGSGVAQVCAEDVPGDVWIQVDDLIQAGDRDGAKRLAAAEQGPDAVALRRYAVKASVVPRDDRAALREALRKAKPLIASGARLPDAEYVAALTLLPETGAWTRTVTAVRTEALRTRLYRLLRDAYNAERSADRGLATASALGYGPGTIAALTDLLGILQRQFRHRELIPLFTWLAAERERAGDTRLALATRVNRGGALLSAGFSRDALSELLQLLPRVIATQSSDLRQMIEDALGQTYLKTGAYARALGHLETAVQLAHRLRDRIAESSALTALGAVWSAIGRFDQATEAYKASLELEGPGASVYHADLLGNIGNSLWRAGAYKRAHASLSSAIAIFKREGETAGLATARRGLGEVTASMGDHEAALALFERSATAFASQPVELAETLGYQAQSLLAVGRVEEAAAKIRRGLALPGVSQSGRVLNWLEGLRARILMVQGKPELALQALRAAMDTIDRTVLGLSDEETYVARQKRRRVYELGVEAAIRVGNARDMVEMIERSRASSLTDTLGRREDLERATLPPALLSKVQDARAAAARALRNYRSQVESGSRDARKAARTALNEIRHVYSELLNKADRERRSRFSRAVTRPMSAAEIHAGLRADETLVYYQVIGDQVHAVVVQHGRERHVALGDVAPVEAAAQAFASYGLFLTVAEQQVDPSAPWLKALHTALVAPLPLAETTRHIYICPDGPLTFLPWPRIISASETSLLPSASVLGYLRAKGQVRGTGILALGDPDYTWKPDVAPGAGPQAARHRGVLRGKRPGRLPATGDEVREILDAAAGHRPRKLLLRKDASERGFFDALGDRRWLSVHLACHGQIDIRTPRHSALIFAASESEDGYFQIPEIVATQIKAELVVLSGCETGLGDLVRGEGLTGFPRAFMAAGASRVLVSLWKVPDAATKALMVEFYAQWLGKGRRLTTALRLAQEKVRSVPKWRHARYWAAWVLWGAAE